MSKIIFRISCFLLIGTVFYQCTKSESFSPGSSDTGVAGSYGRSMIVGQFLYLIDEVNIRTLSLANPDVPQLINDQQIGDRIESIFNLDNRLFIGSGTGLHLYTINAMGIPEFSATFSYDIFPIYPCDPVVANDSFAYVTLNSDFRSFVCGAGTVINEVNGLEIFDVSNFTNPVLIAEYPMVNPKGIGLDGHTLFVCDNEAGLKIFDVSDPLAIQMIAHFDDFVPYDVIPLNGLLLVVGPESVHQFDYSDLNNIKRLSIINIGE
ncbi:MAG: hypothetical protein KDC85_15045 [Saprospiraceae bacterium]|nr:hypothetical protein [Saprospiraceae bacterium]